MLSLDIIKVSSKVDLYQIAANKNMRNTNFEMCYLKSFLSGVH